MGPRVDDVTFDNAGQLAFFDHDANKDRSLRYDGRGFLSTLADASGSIDLLRPAYSSEGLLHSLLREPTSLSPHRLNVLYFAGRPIGIWKKVGTSTATLTRIVTDHLGTPVASLQQAGATLDWHGGFEPFGEDWQAGTLQDSLTKGIFLRMPGQWKDPLWSDATYPMELLYNVHRWYEPQTGRYTSSDPAWDGYWGDINPYLYAFANPILNVDVRGEKYNNPASPGHGSVFNFSECGLLVYGEPFYFQGNQLYKVPSARAGGIVPGVPEKPLLAPPPDVDFICLQGRWYKVKGGPAIVSRKGSISGWVRPASPQEERDWLPPCTEGCLCKAVP